MTTFSKMISVIEENNRINNASWKEWEDVTFLEECYGDLSGDYKEIARVFINALIRDDGENLETYQATMDCLEYGYAFSQKNCGYK